MTFILISGKTGVGKTSVCNKLHKLIVASKYNKQKSSYAGPLDFIADYDVNNKHIVQNSASDNDICIREFCRYIDNMRKKAQPDIIITTIKETDNNNCQMSRMLAVLEEIAKGTPNLEAYFNAHIVNFTSFEPTGLTQNAFVLHLEKQKDANGEELKDDNDPKLKQYWDDSAETVKAVLDIALNRL